MEQTREEKIQEVRYHRDNKLLATDVYMLSDFPITEEQKAELLLYRQALRDMPENPAFPDIPYPKKPDFVK